MEITIIPPPAGNTLLWAPKIWKNTRGSPNWENAASEYFFGAAPCFFFCPLKPPPGAYFSFFVCAH